jgi:hypothetical protein
MLFELDYSSCKPCSCCCGLNMNKWNKCPKNSCSYISLHATDDVVTQTDYMIATTDNFIDTTDEYFVATVHCIHMTEDFIYTTDHCIDTTDDFIYTTDHRIDTTDEFFCCDRRLYMQDRPMYRDDGRQYIIESWIW